jgi:hypothetical protein
VLCELNLYLAPPATVEEDREEDSVPGFMNTLSTSPSKSTMHSPQKPSAKGPMKVRAMAFEDKGALVIYVSLY